MAQRCFIRAALVRPRSLSARVSCWRRLTPRGARTFQTSVGRAAARSRKPKPHAPPAPPTISARRPIHNDGRVITQRYATQRPRPPPAPPASLGVSAIPLRYEIWAALLGAGEAQRAQVRRMARRTTMLVPVEVSDRRLLAPLQALGEENRRASLRQRWHPFAWSD
jgi:hypothetical protein